MVETEQKVENRTLTVSEKFIFKLGLADALRLTMFGALIAIIKDITRMPLHLPGHTSFYWMGILVLGKGLIPKFGSGIVMGVVSGVLAVLLGLGSDAGVFAFFNYFVPGLLLDFLAPVFNYKLEHPVVGVICGTMTSLSKHVANVTVAVLLKIPGGAIAVGLGFATVTHILFGAAGGFLAAILIKRLKPRLTSWE